MSSIIRNIKIIFIIREKEILPWKELGQCNSFAYIGFVDDRSKLHHSSMVSKATELEAKPV